MHSPLVNRAAKVEHPSSKPRLGAGEGEQLLGKQSVIAHTRAKMFQATIIHFNTVLRVGIAKHNGVMQKYFSIKGTLHQEVISIYLSTLNVFLGGGERGCSSRGSCSGSRMQPLLRWHSSLNSVSLWNVSPISPPFNLSISYESLYFHGKG